MGSKLLESSSFWLLILTLLAIPAFLVNLGMPVFLEDESIRALVALEMDISGNFITPTLCGSYYYSKPPLYNWILWASFQVFGEASEWTARFPTILFLALFALLIYYYSCKHFSLRFAICTAPMGQSLPDGRSQPPSARFFRIRVGNSRRSFFRSPS